MAIKLHRQNRGTRVVEIHGRRFGECRAWLEALARGERPAPVSMFLQD